MALPVAAAGGRGLGVRGGRLGGIVEVGKASLEISKEQESAFVDLRRPPYEVWAWLLDSCETAVDYFQHLVTFEGFLGAVFQHDGATGGA